MYTIVHEDSSTAPTKQFAKAVEFQKKPNEPNGEIMTIRTLKEFNGLLDKIRQNNKKLTTVDLSAAFTQSEIKENFLNNFHALTEVLKLNTHITFLNLSNNELSPDAFFLFFSALLENHTLKTVDVSGNGFCYNADIKKYIEMLAKNNGLTKLICTDMRFPEGSLDDVKRDLTRINRQFQLVAEVPVQPSQSPHSFMSSSSSSSSSSAGNEPSETPLTTHQMNLPYPPKIKKLTPAIVQNEWTRQLAVLLSDDILAISPPKTEISYQSKVERPCSLEDISLACWNSHVIYSPADCKHFIKAVRQAVGNYLSIDKKEVRRYEICSSRKSLFQLKFHNEDGKLNAQNFLKEISKIDNFVDMLNKIKELFSEWGLGTGNWEWPDSFKPHIYEALLQRYGTPEGIENFNAKTKDDAAFYVANPKVMKADALAFLDTIPERIIAREKIEILKPPVSVERSFWF